MHQAQLLVLKCNKWTMRLIHLLRTPFINKLISANINIIIFSLFFANKLSPFPQQPYLLDQLPFSHSLPLNQKLPSPLLCNNWVVLVSSELVVDGCGFVWFGFVLVFGLICVYGFGLICGVCLLSGTLMLETTELVVEEDIGRWSS